MKKERRLRVFEDRALRRIFGPKRDEVTGEWKKQHEKLNDLYFSLNTVQVIKSRRMRWAGHVAGTGGEACTGFWGGNLRETDHLEDPDVDGKLILRWIYRKRDVGAWTVIELAQGRDK